MKFYVPPPEPETLAADWAREFAQAHGVKVTVTVERMAPEYATASFDHRPKWQRKAAAG